MSLFMSLYKILSLFVLIVLLLASGQLAAAQPSSTPSGSIDQDPGDEILQVDAAATNVSWFGVSRWLANQREVVLCGLLKDGPAGNAGLRIDDTILKINGEPISDLRSFHAVVGQQRAGTPVSVSVSRDGQEFNVTITPELLPTDGGIGRIKAAAEAGEAWAMMEMGVRLAGLRGEQSYIELDPKAAVEWFRRALDAGDTAAPIFLGQMYLKGAGVDRDEASAQKMFLTARSRVMSNQTVGVRKGVTSAASNSLARMCLNGQGPGAKPELAIPLFRDAAEQGSLYAMWQLGELYEQGKHAKQDLAMAIQWYQVAAKTGYPPAQKALARLQPEATPRVPEAEQAGAVRDARENRENQPQTTDGRVLWKHEDGYFRFAGNRRWMAVSTAYPAPAPPSVYWESFRDNVHVELDDPATGKTVRLTHSSMLVRSQKNASFENSVKGSWLSLGPSQ